MAASRLLSLASRWSATRRLLWQGWYQFLALRYRDPVWTFMNYGYRPVPGQNVRGPAITRVMLEPEDEADRSCIQLYDVVAGAVPLVGLELLEVGCGRGGGAAYVARYLGPRRVVAVDRSPRAVALCRKRFDLPRLSFEVGDAERLPFADASFDAVLNVESSHCYGNLGRFLREVRRVLRPTGQFLYADFRPAADVDAWLAAVRAAGFEIRLDRDLTLGVVAALDADDERKRDLIGKMVDRPFANLFREFAALRGSTIYHELHTGALAYRAFVLSPQAPEATHADRADAE